MIVSKKERKITALRENAPGFESRFVISKRQRKLIAKIIANFRAHSNLRYDFLTPGVVPKPTSEMAKDGPHEEGPGTAGAQRASADLLGAAADPGREEAKRDPEEREENMEATRKAEEKTQGNRELHPLFRKDERKRNHH